MVKREIQIGQHTLSLETGRLAKQADGSVVVRMGDTMVLVTACHSSSPREGIDFLPLTVDYREYTYASGRIPGGFFKREGKATEKETLTSRMIDRPIRPLFPGGWSYETQIIAFVLSADTENDSDVLAITGASAALALSEMPLEKTIAGVRVGLVDGQYIVNPTFPQRKQSRLDLIVAGSKDGIVMVEAGAKEVSEEEVVRALEVAHEAIKELCAAIDSLAGEAGRKKLAKPELKVDAAFQQAIQAKALAPLTAAMRIKGKLENYATVARVEKETIAGLPDDQAGRKGEAKGILHDLQEKVLRDEILEQAASGSTAASSTRSARSPSRTPCCRACTARRCSRAVRPRRWSPSRSAPPTTSRRSRWSTARCGSASCSTTTSRPSRSAKSSRCAARAVARSATARSPSGR